MGKNLATTFSLCLVLAACTQSKKNEPVSGLSIDPGIRNEVEKHIETTKEYASYGDIMQVYLNSGEIQSYQNDSLVISSTFGEYKTPFKSFYLWQGDTLIIDGAFGLWGSIGFGIEILHNKARLYHMLSSDDFPSYAYTENDSLIDRLEVPCTDTKIVLSEMPDSTKKQIIYGYVEFKSASYYSSSNSADEQGPHQKQKLRNNMKLYFKSGKLNF